MIGHPRSLDPVKKTAKIVLGIAIFCGSVMVNVETVGAYSCFGNHCHILIRWRGGMPGAHTMINSAGMSYSGKGGEIINNEMWLIDESSPGCGNNAFSGCWIEAGVQASQSSSAEHFFWAEVVQGGYYSETDMLMQSPGAYSNTFITVQAQQNYSNWLIQMVNPVENFNFSTSVTWGNASMQPNRIDIGEELSGSSGAHSDSAYWYYNEWRDQCCNWYYQDTAPAVFTDHPSGTPPYGYWVNPAAPGNGGGEFTANTP